MPETIRTANERLCSRPRRGGFLAAFVIANLCIAPGTPAHADDGAAFGVVDAIQRAVAALGRPEFTALTLALLGFAVIAIFVLVRLRKAADRIETESRDDVIAMRHE